LKILNYIQYFFYVGINWGWRVASVIILQEIKGEKKYHINTTGADELKGLKRMGIDISHATIYMPVSYSLLEKTLAQICPGDKKHFVDIGCGRGRALCIAAHFGFDTLTGIDFSNEFCEQARKNLSNTKQQIPAINFAVINEDAADWKIPADADCIFLFNPFDELLMKKVLKNIIQSTAENGRSVNVIYANPLYKNLFVNSGFKEIFYSKTLTQFEVSILNYRH
jgi:SAM-dependent methyltransferase